MTRDQEAKIHQKVRELYRKANLDLRHRTPEVLFDLRGKAAGQWRVRDGREQLRFNPEAFSQDWDAHFPDTVAHEVAHSLVYRASEWRRVRPHGAEWRAWMQTFGCQPRVTHNTPLQGRRVKTYTYRCACQTHALSARRHYLIQRRRYRYECRECGQRLRREK
ncbi:MULTISPECIES: SprT-like domain-containing protein [unclassified Thioalkalivibrio]|uniref:SprT family zinc-dependent metalloprotease n=1 Tax=unclassified Thioalkalivibrio TaxID=2621013 RepID=UPI0009D9BC66|nr:MULTISPECIES: SprT-like domain-containing protein [unclassified Thioalkalivibrio]